jgi:hypothetical protein
MAGKERDEEKELTSQQIHALTMYLGGTAIQDISEGLGVDRKTLVQWTKTPEWKAECERRRQEVLEHTRELTKNAGHVALTKLMELAQGIGNPVLDPQGNIVKDRHGKPLRERVGYKIQVNAAIGLAKVLEPKEEKQVERKDLRTLTDEQLEAEIERLKRV